MLKPITQNKTSNTAGRTQKTARRLFIGQAVLPREAELYMEALGLTAGEAGAIVDTNKNGYRRWVRGETTNKHPNMFRGAMILYAVVEGRKLPWALWMRAQDAGVRVPAEVKRKRGANEVALS